VVLSWSTGTTLPLPWGVKILRWGTWIQSCNTIFYISVNKHHQKNWAHSARTNTFFCVLLIFITVYSQLSASWSLQSALGRSDHFLHNNACPKSLIWLRIQWLDWGGIF
jgi:hypothetical protein